ncbi:MMPL family transporter [Prescottella sp. R16]|uniref:MMPL family transporter n=1 Tax=Prescottella sp. R16 TaxID=3064529 RepID=UPI00272DD91C|nr:MMPL family transporter [Prescottella sp. R16]
MKSRFMNTLFGSRRRAGIVVLLWIVLVGALASIAPALEDVENNAGANDPPASSESVQAAELAAREFPRNEGTPAIVVVRGADRAETSAAVDRITASIDGARVDNPSIAAVVTADSPGGVDLRTADDDSEMVVVSLTGDPTDESFQDTVGTLRDLVGEAAGPADAAVTGPAGIATDTVKVFSSGDKILLLGTILLVAIILLVIYRSPVLVVVALAGVGVAMRLAETVGAMMADAGWFDVSSQTASIMTVLLFGVGTDYALIVTARYREALAEEPDRSAAMMRALRGVSEAILSSVSTIVLAMLALLAAISPALRGFGPYLALGVASMGLVAFTFTPALMLLFGGKLFWPSTTRAASSRVGGKVWERVADLVDRSPKTVLVSTLLGLLVMTAGLAGYRESFDFISGFRIDTQSESGQNMIADAFGPGEIAPSTVYVTTPPGTPPPDWNQITSRLSDVDGVARVGERPEVGAGGTTAAFQIVFTDNPYSPEALDRVDTLAAAAQSAAADAGIADAQVLVGGESAHAADIRSALDRDNWVVAALVLVIVAAVLALLLRSVLAPLYLIGTLVLSFTATLGLTTFVTVTVLGDAGIGNRVAVYIFVFLVALGVDYTIFLMSRYRQELSTHPPRAALRVALTRSGGVISSAGLILAATFAVLTTQPIRELFQFGLAMAIGILLDTFVVRPLLVPAIMRLLGDRALWPSVVETRAKPVMAPSHV